MSGRMVYIPMGLLLALSAKAQITTGYILGVVHDATGATVADAKVQVRALETNAAGQVQTGPEGRFRFPGLPDGSYELTVEKAGFARYSQGPIVLRLNQEAELDVKLEVAGVSENVTVTSDAPLINTTNAEMGVNFDRKRISELPLTPSRNVLKLALSVPGVNQLHGGQGLTGYGEGTVPISVNGMRARSNNITIDGQESSNPILMSGLFVVCAC